MIGEVISKLSSTPMTDENWNNIIKNPWTAATDPYVSQLFANEGWMFYAFLMAITVGISYIKSESAAGPLATLLVMGTLLSGMLTIGSMYYFVMATAIALGIILFLLVK